MYIYFLHYPLLLIVMLIYEKLIEVNAHVVPSYRSSTHAYISEKYIWCFNNHEKYLLNDSYINGTYKSFKII